jgi:tRNA1Val (adenine37-N6)-methyltransferase
LDNNVINADETLDEMRGVRVIQKRKGYRFSIDSILLADFADLTGVETAVDLGTGSGIIPILLARRSEELKLVGVELQEGLFDLAQRNVQINSLPEKIEIVKADIKGLKERFKGGGLDLVASNPPYYQVGKGRIGPNKERTLARHEVAVTMADVIEASEFLLKEGGRLVLVYPAFRKEEAVSMMKRYRIGPRRVREVHTREAEFVLIEGEKGYAGDLMEEAPLRL